MVKTLTRFPTFEVLTPEYAFIGELLNNHSMSTGKSPEDIKQLTDTESPELAGSSPKSNGAICGATLIRRKYKLRILISCKLIKAIIEVEPTFFQKYPKECIKTRW